jgi:hypothetical protein
MPRVEIAITDHLLDELRDELREKLSKEAFFGTERRMEGSGLPDYAPAYETVKRVDGLSIIIWADEHPPPHFHVRYQGEDASYSIVDCSRLRGSRGLERYDDRIRAWWAENHYSSKNGTPLAQRIVQLGR